MAYLLRLFVIVLSNKETLPCYLNGGKRALDANFAFNLCFNFLTFFNVKPILPAC